jgi:LPS-assembly lipoprotein
MSWLEISKNGNRLRRGAGLALIAGFLAFGSAGCGFHPMYGTPTAGGHDLTEMMKRVEIAAISSRTGQKLRNELLFGTTGGGGTLPPVYRLDIALRESYRNTLVTQAGNPTGRILQLDAEFRLVRLADNETVFKGASTSEAASDLAGSTGNAGSIYGDTRAALNAQNRAARTLADTLKTRLAAYLSRDA